MPETIETVSIFPDETILGFFLKSAFEHRDRPAFNTFDREWKTLSHGDFLAFVRGAASYLMRSGVKAGDRVAILSENRFEWCAAYLGILMAGATAVPIDAESAWDDIQWVLADSGSVLLFHSEKTGLKLRGPIQKISFDDEVFKEIHHSQDADSRPAVSPKDIASIVYTSGTTGSPKGVMLTQGNLYSDARALISFGFLSEKDNLLAVLPFHHAYPFMCTFLVPVCTGGQITFPRSLKGPELLSTIREKDVTVFMCVPRLLEVLWNRIMGELKGLPRIISLPLLVLLRLSYQLRQATGANLGKLIFRKVHQGFGPQFRFFTSGGARLDPQIIIDLEGMGLTVLEGYGLTETSPVVTFNPLDRRKPGSAGRALPSVEIKIMSPSERGEGEIAVRGPMIMKGYYKDSGATEKAFHEGWFRTGDVGYLDEDGYLYITGREKEIIILSSGKNINPEDVEKEYLKIPLIKEMAVVFRREGGEAGDLYGVIVPDRDYARREKIGNLKEAVKGKMVQISVGLPAHRRVKGFTLHPGPLPRTPLGKLKRYALEEALRTEPGEQDLSREEDRELMEDQVGRKVADCIAPLLSRKRPVLSSDHLELDLGLDSLQRIELVVGLERTFGVELPEAVASEVQTVSDLVAKIKFLLQEGEARSQAPSRWKDILSAEPSEEEKKRIGLNQGRVMWLSVVFLIGILRVILKLFFRFEVKGVENIPDPPFIITPNHCSNIDGFVVGAAVPNSVFRDLYFQGYRVYFTGAAPSFFARMAHVIPIDAEAHVIKALQLSSYLLRRKLSLCIFPEGGRSPDGNLMEFKKGVIVLAREHRVPVVPVKIQGTFDVLPRGAAFPKFRRICVTIGSPLKDFTVSPNQEGIDEDRFLAEILREKVRSLE